MEKTSSEELIVLERQNLCQSMEKLKAGALHIINCTRQLKAVHKHNERVEANNNKMSHELELKDKELQSLSLELDKRATIFEANKKKMSRELELKDKRSSSDIDKRGKIFEANVKKRSRELELKEKELQSLSSDLDRRVEIFGKEKSQAGNLKKLVDECAEELRLKRNELTAKLDTSTRIQREIESKKTRLRQYSAELRKLCSEAGKVQIRKKEMEEETDRKNRDLALVVFNMEESGRQLAAVNEQLEFQRRLFEYQSWELASKEGELESVRESIKISNSDLELKENRAQASNTCLKVCGEEIDSKSKELGEIQKLIGQQTSELCVMRNQCDVTKLLIHELSEELVTKEKTHKEVSETISRSSFEMEEKAREIKAAEAQASDLDVRCDRLRQEVQDKEKELDLLMNQVKAKEDKLCVMNKEHDSLKVMIQGLAEELHAKKKLHEEVLEAICRSSSEVESAETETRVLNVKAQGFRGEVEERIKEVDWLKNQINAEENKLVQLRQSIQDCTSELNSRRGQVEAMKNIQRELELKKQLTQMSSGRVKHEAPINYTSQQNATEAEVVIEDALMHHGISTLLERHEVSSVLRGSLKPAEFILELVQGEIREEVDLQDSLVENWVLLFEELAKIQREDEPELQAKAKKVASLWKRKITTEAPKSYLEALAFLLFIVAYGLGELINQEEAALLASTVAKYEHAPTLFNSLKLNIPEMVEYLIEKRQYIPAVQLICLFKLDKDFPSSHLLTEEIMDLRRSTFEKGPAESSQAKEKDGGRLRAILELVADYKLEVNLPGDLIAKLMILRENSSPVIHCSARHHTSASSPQANSPNLFSAQHSSVSLGVPKPEVKPYLN